MPVQETVAWILGTDLGLISIATIFASAWIRVSRIDKLESSLDKLWEKFTKVDVLENKIEAIEHGIDEIKEMIKEQRDRHV